MSPYFVALMKQDNTLPSGHYTIDYWTLPALPVTVRVIVLKKLDLLQKGIDISEVAIIIAHDLAVKLAADDRLRYQVSDVCSLPFYAETFTHVLGGCNFAFIQAREQALSEVSCVLKVEGVLRTSNFYDRRMFSDKIITEVYSAIGFKPDSAWTLHYWCNFFGKAGLGLDQEKIMDYHLVPMMSLKKIFVDI